MVWERASAVLSTLSKFSYRIWRAVLKTPARFGVGFRGWAICMPQPAKGQMTDAGEPQRLEVFVSDIVFFSRVSVFRFLVSRFKSILESRANVQSTFGICHLIQAAFQGESTIRRRHFPQCCLQGGGDLQGHSHLGDFVLGPAPPRAEIVHSIPARKHSPEGLAHRWFSVEGDKYGVWS